MRRRDAQALLGLLGCCCECECPEERPGTPPRRPAPRRRDEQTGGAAPSMPVLKRGVPLDEPFIPRLLSIDTPQRPWYGAGGGHLPFTTRDGQFSYVKGPAIGEYGGNTWPFSAQLPNGKTLELNEDVTRLTPTREFRRQRREVTYLDDPDDEATFTTLDPLPTEETFYANGITLFPNDDPDTPGPWSQEKWSMTQPVEVRLANVTPIGEIPNATERWVSDRIDLLTGETTLAEYITEERATSTVKKTRASFLSIYASGVHQIVAFTLREGVRLVSHYALTIPNAAPRPDGGTDFILLPFNVGSIEATRDQVHDFIVFKELNFASYPPPVPERVFTSPDGRIQWDGAQKKLTAFGQSFTGGTWAVLRDLDGEPVALHENGGDVTAIRQRDGQAVVEVTTREKFEAKVLKQKAGTFLGFVPVGAGSNVWPHPWAWAALPGSDAVAIVACRAWHHRPVREYPGRPQEPPDREPIRSPPRPPLGVTLATLAQRPTTEEQLPAGKPPALLPVQVSVDGQPSADALTALRKRIHYPPADWPEELDDSTSIRAKQPVLITWDAADSGLVGDAALLIRARVPGQKLPVVTVDGVVRKVYPLGFDLNRRGWHPFLVPLSSSVSTAQSQPMQVSVDRPISRALLVGLAQILG